MGLTSKKTHPGSWHNIRQLALFELQRLLLQRRGLLALLTFVLLWLLVLAYPIKSAAELMTDPNIRDLASAIDNKMLSQLFRWPVPELAVYWALSLYLFPMFCIMLAAGQFAADKQRGTLRFLTLHCSRSALFFGRFLGMMLIQLLLLILTVVATIVLAMIREPSLSGVAMTDAIWVTINLFVILLPYTALMSVLSLLATSNRQATIYAVLFFTVSAILLPLLDYALPLLGFLDYLVPGMQTDGLLAVSPKAALSSAPLPIIQCIAYLALGLQVIKRGDL
ncbi:ABC transporter permease subunit [Shewanella dokdonensis]|uniref:ABC transporter permease subunit n=1 Tax=Shewanella dokdonensis TaxID=712036 RepID=UPI00200C35A0|nr:ABC transporter permease subunit [Shewanella dokdonensis]MCL1076021.1 ABC transporter permease [Shewanella dokdonensis]